MMKKIASFCLLLVFFSCADDSKAPEQKPEGDADAARMFIRAALNGNYKEAQKLIVQDSINLGALANAEILYLNRNVTEQRGLRESSIIIHDTKRVNDSVSIIEYSNSFTKKKQSVKAVRVNGEWLVDFKYTAFNNPDSTSK